jgi:tRNA pseudouridine38-40 synthase
VTEQELVRLRVDFAYDGTDFAGWSKQPGLRTVQGELESALGSILQRHGHAPTVTVAGRTDAGVHAAAQVAHVDLTRAQLASIETTTLPRRLNAIAGSRGDIRVVTVGIAPPGFDARFSATWRRYTYRIADSGAKKNPLDRQNTLWHRAPLDVSAMNDAASALLGLHDWASFCKPREGATTIRTLEEFQWVRLEDGVLLGTIRADAFCHNMVRSLVGASIAVGEGKLSPVELCALRDAATRTSTFKVVAPHGLTLDEVGYPDDDELESRATQTRARRDRGLTADSSID